MRYLLVCMCFLDGYGLVVGVSCCSCKVYCFIPNLLILCFLIVESYVNFLRFSTVLVLSMFLLFIFYCFNTVMAFVFVQICFRKLLRDICQQFSISAPVYGIPVENEGLVSVYVDVEVSKGDSITEAIRCWGAPSSNVDETE